MGNDRLGTNPNPRNNRRHSPCLHSNSHGNHCLIMVSKARCGGSYVSLTPSEDTSRFHANLRSWLSITLLMSDCEFFSSCKQSLATRKIRQLFGSPTRADSHSICVGKSRHDRRKRCGKAHCDGGDMDVVVVWRNSGSEVANCVKFASTIYLAKRLPPPSAVRTGFPSSDSVHRAAHADLPSCRLNRHVILLATSQLNHQRSSSLLARRLLRLVPSMDYTTWQQ